MKITKPTLLVSEEVSRRNIGKMMAKANANGLKFAPHFKTHQSKAVGEWFREAGVTAISVSSVDMALYFAAADWKDITIAFPINMLEVGNIKDLAARVALSVLVVDPLSAKLLNAKVDVRVEVMIEIDCGYNRSGVWWEDHKVIQDIISYFDDSQHFFKGFYCHSGHTYHERGKQRVLEIFNDSLHKLRDLQLRFADVTPTISVGDTPSCSLSTEFAGVYSIHAGNFVFYDLTQEYIGSCSEADIAIVLAVPVVSKNVQRQQLVVHGGGVHLAKDVLITEDGQSYGKIVPMTHEGWGESYQGCTVISLSQEHGVVQVTPEVFEAIEIGDILGILPVHSCMTADVMGEMYTTGGIALDHMKKAGL
jgi:D-serine deaminase-like pyridoxal phosphate-dependent protein